ncbi:hypothetical protein [Saccharopolyspora sp. NPDC049426]|uniref:hypothetical protein n=1 Tax=Saccharopolyspora sp. NPDC049426 TaxID=3155652 RepID=UPI00343F670C
MLNLRDAVSPLIPLSAEGQRHTVLWGGTNPPEDLASLRAYLSSAQKLRLRMRMARADVELSNHSFCDAGLQRMQQMLDDPQADNPFVLGPHRTQQYMRMIETMLRGRIADATDAPAPTRARHCC